MLNTVSYVILSWEDKIYKTCQDSEIHILKIKQWRANVQEEMPVQDEIKSHVELHHSIQILFLVLQSRMYVQLRVYPFCKCIYGKQVKLLTLWPNYFCEAEWPPLLHCQNLLTVQKDTILYC
ncbi:hypothetical protein T07_7309 [Trichinella nelsoni]|uniref:Uncharacterized protein n=1 Tax=Trichinella nelsoni TaxID=6336 RepID=A0A0V0SEP8_9BILA|nr:hypothetical protein T07_7309 [Trichinella nelsoni]